MVRAPFRVDLTPSQPGTPIRGHRARFTLDDGRHVVVHVPKAISCENHACPTDGFRIEILDDSGPVELLTALDLVSVFGAREAMLALRAFAGGDLRGARRLAERAGSPWRPLLVLLAAHPR